MNTHNTYRSFIDTKFLTSDFGVWIWEPQSDLLFFNKTYMDMLGYAHDDFPFHISTWANLLHPEDREKSLLHQRQFIDGTALGDTFENKFRLRTASGKYLWILSRCSILCRDEHGKALRVHGMHINMKALERTLETMDIEHDRMLFALEAANDGLWDWNPQTDEVYFSPRYISMLGYKPHEFPPILQSWLDKVHPDDLEKTIDIQREIVKSPAMGDTFECVYRFMNVTGNYKWILGRGKVTKRSENGEAIRLVGLHTDVTELRNAQEELVKLLHQDNLTHLYSRFYFDSILHKVSEKDYPLSIIFCDIDGLKLVNDILGHTAGDQMLIDAASILRQAIPQNGIAARLGGDEFAILLCSTTKSETDAIAACIQEKIDLHNDIPNVLPVFVSMGIESSEHNVPIYRLLTRADEAMLKNKQNQRKSKQILLMSRIEKIIDRKIDFTDDRLEKLK